MLALVLGVAVGVASHRFLSDAAAIQVAAYYSLPTDVFLNLIKMIIAPLVFATVVSGIARTGDPRVVGRVGARALAWFVGASLISLLIGLVMASWLRPGSGVHLALPPADAAATVNAHALNAKDFLSQVFPSSVIDAMAKNNILQILVFAVFFGVALAGLGEAHAGTAIRLAHELVPIMLRITNAVMLFAPFGVFGAVAASVTLHGLAVLAAYGQYLGGFYLSLGLMWMILVLAGALVLQGSVLRLLRLIRAPILLAFSTATSEAAYPGALQQLETFGVSERVAGLVLPLGYGFNLDGSMINVAFAALFIAQVYAVPLTLGEKITLLLVLMVSSKGIAGVPRAALVVVAAVLPMFHLPAAGVALILGIDHFLDMGRSATNVLGNCIATAVVAKWEGALGKSPQNETNLL